MHTDDKQKGAAATPPSHLTAQDAVDQAKKVGTDAVRTAAVWTLAGLMTQGAREVLNKLSKQLTKR